MSVKLKKLVTRGAARQLLKCKDPEVLIAGSAGTGKSYVCLTKLHLMALANPGMRGLIVRKTAESLKNTALVTWEEHVVREAMELGIMRFYGGSARRPAAYIYKNGSQINLGGMDKPTKIMSTEYDVIYVQEATELNITDWESLNSRLRNGRMSFQQLMADCNPDAPTHFLKVRADSGALTMLKSMLSDNPRFYDGTGIPTPEGKRYAARLDALTGVRRARLRDGIWAGADGLVYDEYEPKIHEIEPFEIPEHWPRYWSIDFGYENPFVCQWWAEDPDTGYLYLYREIYESHLRIDLAAKAILDQVAHPRPAKWRDAERRPAEEVPHYEGREWFEPRPNFIVSDHDAGERKMLQFHLGQSTRAAKKHVKDGIELVQLRMQFSVTDDSPPKLYIFKNARVKEDPRMRSAGKPTSTAEEIVQYIWNDKGDIPKDEPLKKNDHGCDAMRYLVVAKDSRSRARADRTMQW